MNTIHRRRQRPRDRSVNFRSLWWVVLREAALRIAYPASLGAASEPQARVACTVKRSALVREVCGAIIAARPERRYWP
jgi:hypothetical protein